MPRVEFYSEGYYTGGLNYINHAGRGFCRLVQFINHGVLVSGNTATVHFRVLGGFETFQCDLDREGFNPCEILRELSCKFYH